MARQRTSPRRSGNDKNAGRNTLRSVTAMQIKAKNRNRPNYNGFSFIEVVRVRSKHTSYVDVSSRINEQCPWSGGGFQIQVVPDKGNNARLIYLPKFDNRTSNSAGRLPQLS